MVLRRDTPVHLYAQIANILRARIQDGEYVVGDRIPSEAELARSFGVSAVTIRQALEELKGAGLLEGRQGAGTYVAATPEQHSAISLSVPLEAVSDPMSEYEARLLSSEIVPAPADVAGGLPVAAGEPCQRVRRLRVAPQGPVGYATSYYPLWLGALLTAEDLQSPLLMDALEAHGVVFSGATQSIEASLASFDTAEVLGVPVGSPVLLVRRAYELADGSGGYVVINRHPSPLFRYYARLTRRKGSADRQPTAGVRQRWVLEGLTEEHA